MDRGLYIFNQDIIRYNPLTKKEVGPAMYCEGFSLNLKGIRIVAIFPRLPFDDERLFLLLVDRNGHSFPLPDAILNSKAIKTIEAKIRIESVRDIEWKKFEYDDHYGFNSKVIYPSRLYGKSMFQKSFDSWESLKKV